MKKCAITLWSDLKPFTPNYVLLASVDLVLIRAEADELSALSMIDICTEGFDVRWSY